MRHTNGQSGILNWQRGEKGNEEQTVSTPLSFQRTNVKLLCLHSTTAIDNIKRLVIRKQKSSFWGPFSKKLLNSPYAPNSILEPSHTSSLAFGHLAQTSVYFLAHWGTPSVFAEAVLQTIVICYALDFDHLCHKHLLMKLHKDIDMTSLGLWSPCPFFFSIVWTSPCPPPPQYLKLSVTKKELLTLTFRSTCPVYT